MIYKKMEQNPFRDINSVKEFTKKIIYEILDHKFEKIPIFSPVFKDFPSFKRLNFGVKMGVAFTFVMLQGSQANANPDTLNLGIREAVEDIHDDLKSIYLKLENS